MRRRISIRPAGLACAVLAVVATTVVALALDDSPAVNAAESAAVAGSEQTIRVTIPIGAFAVRHTERGDEVSVEDFGALLVPGKPHLPAKIFAIAIPPGAGFVGISSTVGDAVELAGTYDVLPAPLHRVIDGEDPALLARDEARYADNYAATYGADEPYPAAAVEFVRTAGYRGYNLVDVRVIPFAYRPLTQRLMYYPEITVEVSYRQPAAGFAMIFDDSPATEGKARELVLNYDEAQTWRPPTASLRSGLHDFVIITLDSLVDSVQPLVDWETTKGRTVQVVTTTWIDANYSGYDLAEKTRNFLREKYPSEQWGILDVLLVGHYDDVPMRRTAQDLGYGKPETDFYFAELSLPDSQSWDSDGDHRWGEDSDPIDFYAEVNVGRIPWSEAVRVQNICTKMVAFEQNQDPAFKRSALLPGAFFWDVPDPRTDNAVLMEEIANRPWMVDWNVTRLHEKNSDCWSYYASETPLLHDNVVSTWENGKYAFVTWAGHGSPVSAHILGLGAPAMIESADCAWLGNDYPAVVFADACSNGDTDYDNIGRQMIRWGGVGFLGATKVALGCPGWTGVLDGSTQSLAYYFAGRMTSGNGTLGQAHQWALERMYTEGLWGALRYETFEWGAVLGNPNLSLAPRYLDITLPDGAPQYIAPGGPVAFSVHIDDGIEQVLADSATLHYRYDGGDWANATLADLGSGDYQATLPPPSCGDSPEFYISAEGALSGMAASPYGAPGETYVAVVGRHRVLLNERLDVDPGWATTGQWAFGQPAGGGGEYGGPDPKSGHTGVNVYGFNLSGDYPSNLVERTLTSAAIDCTGQADVRVSFWRWLGVEGPDSDHASFGVSNDGVHWTTWGNTAEIADREWNYEEFDISAIADDQPTVYLRWTMGTTDGAWQYCGWNVDDILVTSWGCSATDPADLDASGTVDLTDLGLLLGDYGCFGGGCVGDVDADGDTDLTDLGMLLGVYGT